MHTQSQTHKTCIVSMTHEEPVGIYIDLSLTSFKGQTPYFTLKALF